MVQPFLVFFIRVYLHSFPKPTPLDIYYKRRLLKIKKTDGCKKNLDMGENILYN